MEGMLSPAGRPSAKDGDDWIGVFRQRGVWQLTRDGIERWVARNRAFFDMLRRLVPRGARVLELGCGPGRHALGAATLGYKVLGIDIVPEIVEQAQANARAVMPDCDVEFRVADMFALDLLAPPETFQAVTHGGVMEHLDCAGSIRDALQRQLQSAPVVIFDVPFDSPKNHRLFARDTIFRQLWTPEQWLHEVLSTLNVIEWRTELHEQDNMTDDLVLALGR